MATVRNANVPTASAASASGPVVPGEESAAPPDASPALKVVLKLFAPIFWFLTAFGEHMILLGKSFVWLFRRPFRARLFFEQMQFVGVGSLPIVMLVGLFAGAVSALQALLALTMFQQQRWVGLGVGISLARELAPVFTSLMITARAGSAMATEIGSMRIYEQIDALHTFAVNPIQYLVTPRVVASIIMLPVMTMVFNVVGLVGGYFVSVVLYDVDFGQAADLYRFYTDPSDYVQGMIKATVFGLAMAITACYQGMNVRGGAKELGLATTRAVVASSVATLVLDYPLIQLFTVIWPFGE
jgi:phospholipid/cholesterol/gamma-HCH transport system permease protein